MRYMYFWCQYLLPYCTSYTSPLVSLSRPRGDEVGVNETTSYSGQMAITSAAVQLSVRFLSSPQLPARSLVFLSYRELRYLLLPYSTRRYSHTLLGTVLYL